MAGIETVLYQLGTIFSEQLPGLIGWGLFGVPMMMSVVLIAATFAHAAWATLLRPFCEAVYRNIFGSPRDFKPVSKDALKQMRDPLVKAAMELQALQVQVEMAYQESVKQPTNEALAKHVQDLAVTAQQAQNQFNPQLEAYKRISVAEKANSYLRIMGIKEGLVTLASFSAFAWGVPMIPAAALTLATPVNAAALGLTAAGLAGGSYILHKTLNAVLGTILSFVYDAPDALLAKEKLQFNQDEEKLYQAKLREQKLAQDLDLQEFKSKPLAITPAPQSQGQQQQNIGAGVLDQQQQTFTMMQQFLQQQSTMQQQQNVTIATLQQQLQQLQQQQQQNRGRGTGYRGRGGHRGSE